MFTENLAEADVSFCGGIYDKSIIVMRPKNEAVREYLELNGFLHDKSLAPRDISIPLTKWIISHLITDGFTVYAPTFQLERVR